MEGSCQIDAFVQLALMGKVFLEEVEMRWRSLEELRYRTEIRDDRVASLI